MKTCNASGCSNPVFNNKYGYCKFHLWMSQEYRDDRFRKANEKARKSPYKPLSPKKGYKIPKVSKKRSEELKTYSQMDMFKEIWHSIEPPRICPVSLRVLDKYEGTGMFHWLFAHVLPKGKYPELKLVKENIMVVHPEVHTLYDQGTQEQRGQYPSWNWNVLYKKREELKERYK